MLTTERASLLSLEIHLQDAANNPARVTGKNELARFFGKDWRSVMQLDEEEEVVTEDEDDRQGGGRKVRMKVVGERRHWLTEALASSLEERMLDTTPSGIVAHLKLAMVKWLEEGGEENMEQLQKILGGEVVAKTSWGWWEIPDRSWTRDFEIIAQTAIQETVRADSYRKRLLKDCPAAAYLRKRLQEILEMDGYLYTFADGLKCPNQPRPTETISRLMADLEAAKDLSKDQQDLAKLARLLGNHRMALMRPVGKKERIEDVPIAAEAALGMNMYLRVSELYLSYPVNSI